MARNGEDVGVDQIWALHGNGHVLCRPINTSGFTASPWSRTETDTNFRHIVADHLGSVWAISAEDGSLYRRSDISTSCPSGTGWQLIDFKVDIEAITLGPSGVWAICRRHGLLYRASMDEDEEWGEVEPPDSVDAFQIRSMTVDGSGMLFMLTQSGDMYCCPSKDRTSSSWSTVDPPSISKSGVWSLLGYKEKPKALVADKKIVWCLMGEKGNDLWRKSSSTSVDQKASPWEQTNVPRDGLVGVYSSRTGLYTGFLWAVASRGRLMFCPNASLREAAALEWTELDKTDGWVEVCVVAQHQRRRTMSMSNGSFTSEEEEEMDVGASSSTGGTPSQSTPTHRKYRRRKPSGGGDANVVMPKSQKRRHVDDENDTGERELHAARKYIHLSSDISVAVALPFLQTPSLSHPLPPADREAFLQQFEYPFSLEEQIISAVEDDEAS